MSTPTPGPTPATVGGWPRVTAVLRSPVRASLAVNGAAHACEAPTADRLRYGVLARAAAVAGVVGRPVRLHLTGDSGAQDLAVHPDGAVHRLTADGTPAATPLPVPAASPCRRCGQAQPLARATCAGCGTVEPHRVETTAVPVLDVTALTSPDAEVVERLRAPAATPAARLHVAGAAPVTFHGRAALGRNPSAAPGRTAVRVTSPGMLVSKTHLLVEVDEHGTIRATDCGSTNGTVVVADPPRRLAPGTAHVLASGTTVRLGDVTCRVEVVETA